MQALQFTKFGPPSVLQFVELPTPSLGEGMALIRVHAASINPSDVKNVEGRMEGTELPRVPGRDFSGVVEQGPTEWLGREVWGADGDIGFSIDGTHAELVAVPVASLTPKPGNLSHAETSALGVNFLAAWLGAIDYAHLETGETIAVIGAGGGVGGAVIQIAKALGCHVIAIDRHRPPADSPAGKRLDAYFDSGADIASQVRDLTKGRGVDVVFDAVGGVMFEPALKCLAHRGRLVEISATGRRRVEFDLLDFYHSEGQIFGADTRKLNGGAARRILSALTRGFEDSHYEAPVIAATFPLERGVEAYEAVANGTAGRIVLTPRQT